MHVGSATLVTDHLDWDHVFTAGLTQAPTHILVEISLSAAHLNFSPGLIWALNRCLLAERGGQAKAKLLLKGSLWTSDSAMQLCRAQSSTGNGCKVLGENERCQDFSHGMKNATGKPCTSWFWDQVIWFLNQRRSWCHCWRCPLWGCSSPVIDNQHLTALPLCSLPTAVCWNQTIPTLL